MVSVQLLADAGANSDLSEVLQRSIPGIAGDGLQPMIQTGSDDARGRGRPSAASV
jgi:hypothetical protein